MTEAAAPTTPAPMTPAVVVDHVTKHFRLYHERNQHLKSTLLRGRDEARSSGFYRGLSEDASTQ